MTEHKYPAIVKEGFMPGTLRADFPDIPDCCCYSKPTLEEALADAEYALKVHMAFRISNHNAIPRPSSLASIPHEPGEIARSLVRVELPDQAAMRDSRRFNND